MLSSELFMSPPPHSTPTVFRNYLNYPSPAWLPHLRFYSDSFGEVYNLPWRLISLWYSPSLLLCKSFVYSVCSTPFQPVIHSASRMKHNLYGDPTTCPMLAFAFEAINWYGLSLSDGKRKHIITFQLAPLTKV